MEKNLVDLATLPTDQLEAILANRKAAETEEKNKQREAYETLKSDTVKGLCANALMLHGKLLAFKTKAFEDMSTLYKLLQEYSERHNDGKGNFTLEDGDCRVVYKRQGRPSFDERADQAEKHIIDFVNSKFKDDADTRELIMSLLERKKGELEITLIQKLYKMEDRFDDENWKRGIALLKESYSYKHSKDYLSFFQRDEQNVWQPINLHFSNI